MTSSHIQQQKQQQQQQQQQKQLSQQLLQSNFFVDSFTTASETNTNGNIRALNLDVNSNKMVGKYPITLNSLISCSMNGSGCGYLSMPPPSDGTSDYTTNTIMLNSATDDSKNQSTLNGMRTPPRTHSLSNILTNNSNSSPSSSSNSVDSNSSFAASDSSPITPVSTSSTIFFNSNSVQGSVFPRNVNKMKDTSVIGAFMPASAPVLTTSTFNVVDGELSNLSYLSTNKHEFSPLNSYFNAKSAFKNTIDHNDNDNLQHFWDARMKDIADAMAYLELI